MEWTKCKAPDDTTPFLNMWNELIDVVCDSNPEKIDFLNKYFAHCVQKPFERPDVAIVLTGQKRIGKDTLINFFMQYVIGMDYCINYDSSEQFWDKFDTGRMNKVVVKLEEALGDLNRRNAHAFKTRITSQNIIYNPKGSPAINCENFARYFLTTNEANPVEVDERFVMFPVNPRLKMNREFFHQVYHTLFTPEGGAAIGNFLAGINISDFIPAHDRPAFDDYTNAIITAERSCEELFIEQWNGEETSASDLFKLYCQYCINQDLPYCRSVKAFGMKLLGMIRDRVIVKNMVRNIGMVYSKP